MRFAIAADDAGDHVGIDGVALVRPVDGNPERLSALFANHAARVVHCPAHLSAVALQSFAAGWRCSASGNSRRSPDPGRDKTPKTKEVQGLAGEASDSEPARPGPSRPCWAARKPNTLKFSIRAGVM